MTTRDYSWLVSAVGDTLNKTNLTAKVPDFIRFGEDDINARLFDRLQEQTIDIEVTDGEYPLPARFRDVLSITCEGDPLVYMTPEVFDGLADSTVEPMGFYTIVDETFLFKPTTDGTVQLRYRSGLCHLSSYKALDWLQCERPAARLYAALKHSAPYLRDDERLVTWARLYEEQIAGIEAMQPREPVRLRADDLVNASPIGRRHCQ